MTDRIYKITSSYTKKIKIKKNKTNKTNRNIKEKIILTINTLAITVKHLFVQTTLLNAVVAGRTFTKVCVDVGLKPSLRVSYFPDFLTHTSIRTIDVTPGL